MSNSTLEPRCLGALRTAQTPPTRNSLTPHRPSWQFGRVRPGDCLISGGGWEGQRRAQLLEKCCLIARHPWTYLARAVLRVYHPSITLVSRPSSNMDLST